MIRLASILFCVISAFQINAQISIDKDAILLDIQSQLPTDWKMEVIDSSIYITYPHAIEGVIKQSSKDKVYPDYANANAAPEGPDTVNLKSVKFILLSFSVLISEKEAKKIVKKNNAIYAKIESLPKKLKIDTRPGKGPTPMPMFRDDGQQAKYRYEKHKLESQLKEEFIYHTDVYCIYTIQFPYLSNDFTWDDEKVVDDVNFLNELLRTKIKQFDI